jgi:hypothetical protein
MKNCKSAIAGFAIALALPMTVQAQSLIGTSPNGVAGGQLEVAGVAPQGCVIQTPAQGAVINATVTPGPNSAQVSITNLVDSNTGVPQAANVEMQFPVTCNVAHNLTIATAQGGLVLQGGQPPGPGITNRLNYQVSATWAGRQASSASTAPLQISSPDAATGQLDVNISIPGGGTPLEAGVYSDSLVVNLVPAS